MAVAELRRSIKTGTTVAIVAAVVASASGLLRYSVLNDPSCLEQLDMVCIGLCLTIYAVFDMPKGNAVWEISRSTRNISCLMAMLIPAMHLYRVSCRELPTQSELMYLQLSMRHSSIRPPIAQVVGGGILGLLRLSPLVRTAVSLTSIGITNTCFAVAYFRLQSLGNSTSLAHMCWDLSWRCSLAFAIGIFGCRLAACLLRPCATIVDVLEETQLEGETYQALATRDCKAEGANGWRTRRAGPDYVGG
jgi:hypothetical protein